MLSYTPPLRRQTRIIDLLYDDDEPGASETPPSERQIAYTAVPIVIPAKAGIQYAIASRFYDDWRVSQARAYWSRSLRPRGGVSCDAPKYL
jgi:hypothetical protein